jgi:hypothetical protein
MNCELWAWDEMLLLEYDLQARKRKPFNKLLHQRQSLLESVLAVGNRSGAKHGAFARN